MSTTLARRATDALLIVTGLLLATAVLSDVQRRVALQHRMHVDRQALRVYMRPRVVDAHLMTITVHRTRDLVCVPTRTSATRRERVCVRVAQTTTNAGRVLDAYLVDNHLPARQPRRPHARSVGRATDAHRMRRRTTASRSPSRQPNRSS